MLTRAGRSPRPRPRDLGSDRGVTLMELAVVMSLTFMIGAMTLTFFVGSNRATNNAADTSTTTANSRTAMTTMTSMLRLADTPTSNAGYSTARFTTFTTNTVVFYSNVDANRSGSGSRSAPDKVSFTASGTKLTERIYAPLAPYPADYTANYPSTATTTKVLLTNLANTNLFAYKAFDSTSNTFVAAATGTSIAQVTIGLTLTPGLPTGSVQTLTSTVGITGALS